MERTLVMGILNVTPDSFADGGKFFTFDQAIERAKEMISEGVDVIDVGGESTRPGAKRVSEQDEIDRVVPVVTELVSLGANVSVDTMRSKTAEAAIGAGAKYVNDVSGGLADENMAKLINALVADKLIEKGNFKLDINDGKLSLNGKVQSEEINQKYKTLIDAIGNTNIQIKPEER